MNLGTVSAPPRALFRSTFLETDFQPAPHPRLTLQVAVSTDRNDCPELLRVPHSPEHCESDGEAPKRSTLLVSSLCDFTRDIQRWLTADGTLNLRASPILTESPLAVDFTNTGVELGKTTKRRKSTMASKLKAHSKKAETNHKIPIRKKIRQFEDVVVRNEEGGLWIGRLMHNVDFSRDRKVTVKWFDECNEMPYRSDQLTYYRLSHHKDKISIKAIHPCPVKLTAHKNPEIWSIKSDSLRDINAYYTPLVADEI